MVAAIEEMPFEEMVEEAMSDVGVSSEASGWFLNFGQLVID
jgi:hypothetical protein